MLEMLRGKRLVFVGDSLNRNMWESLICILRNSVKDKKKVYEEFGRHHFRGEASYSFVFEVSLHGKIHGFIFNRICSSLDLVNLVHGYIVL